MIESHPHQWSSQLSTVMSESEGDSSRSASRSVSPVSGAPSGSINRRSSTGWASSHSRQMLSISSSLAQQLEETRTHSRSNSGSLDRPQPTYSRGNLISGGGAARTVRDQDEHGDGLADLREIAQQPSRSGLSAFFGSSSSSGRNLHSSGSSRANSLTTGSIPAWARVYYGSGERRFLSTLSINDGGGDESRPASSFRSSGSPNTDHFPLNIYSARKRPREIRPGTGARPGSDVASLETGDGGGVRRGLRKMTSSIWSPHLRTDRRASRYSIWDPPSVQWSAESGVLGRRNVQVVFFMVGIVFPFAWMTAAFLPLPPDPRKNSKIVEREHQGGEYGIPEAYKRQLAMAEELRFQNAKWWRNLNRCMSVVGLLLLGAVAALVVIGVREGWGQKTPGV